MRSRWLLLVTVLGCGGSQKPVAAPEPAPRPAEPPADDSAPWTHAKVSLGDVSQAYLTEWQRAANRTVCPLIVATDLGAGAGALPRKADFGEGWGVAYDKDGLPGTADGARCVTCGRAAFGVAGTAAPPTSAPRWDKMIKWSDGSIARYGAAGASGGFTAFIEMKGAGCAYNVWSAVSEDHLLVLLRGLRRVDGM